MTSSVENLGCELPSVSHFQRIQWIRADLASNSGRPQVRVKHYDFATCSCTIGTRLGPARKRQWPWSQPLVPGSLYLDALLGSVPRSLVMVPRPWSLSLGPLSLVPWSMVLFPGPTPWSLRVPGFTPEALGLPLWRRGYSRGKGVAPEAKGLPQGRRGCPWVKGDAPGAKGLPHEQRGVDTGAKEVPQGKSILRSSCLLGP